jgi:hypothetical protein
VYARAAALLWVSALLAQTPSGEIRIDIRDSSGGAVEVSGKLENLATHTTQDFTTDSTGHYAATGLAVGRYRLEVKKDGFTPQILSVDLGSATPVSRTITLIPAAAHASVDVIGVTPLAGGDLPSPRFRLPCRSPPPLTSNRPPLAICRTF